MTQFSQIELLYKQFKNLTDEILELISQEDFNSANIKIKAKDHLIKKIALARKTTKTTNEEQEQLNVMDKEISESNKKLIEKLSLEHKEIAKQLNETKNKVKISSAYEIKTNIETGNMIDTEE